MKDFSAGGEKIALSICAAACLLAAHEATVLAQASRIRSAERRVERLRNQSEQYEREELRGERENASDDPQAQRRAQALTEQVKRDFESLQTSYNKILLVVSSKDGGAKDSAAAAAAAAEAGKRAARLKENLALPRQKTGEAGKTRAISLASDAQTGDPLHALLKHIYSFVTNPLFESPTVLNVEHAEKAGRDLDRIIELSERVRRDGGGAKKTHH